MRHKTAGAAGKRETDSWKTKDDWATSDYAAAQEEAEDAALREMWSKTPNAQPMKRPGEAREAQYLRFLTLHKLMPDESTVETLRGLLEGENTQRKKELLHELEMIPSGEGDTETYEELRSYIMAATSEAAESTDVLGNSVEAAPAEKKPASRSDVKRAKRVVEIKRDGGMHTGVTEELAARGLYSPE